MNGSRGRSLVVKRTLHRRPKRVAALLLVIATTWVAVAVAQDLVAISGKVLTGLSLQGDLETFLDDEPVGACPSDGHAPSLR